MNVRSHQIFAGIAFCVVVASGQAHAQDHSHGSSREAPWSQADAHFDPEKMADTRAHLQHHHGGSSFAMIMLDRAEIQWGEDDETGVWDGAFWYGDDINKLYIKSEGEYSFSHDEFEEAEFQLLWSRAVSTYFDVQAGVRYDVEPDGLAHAVLGFQGLAPYWFEVDGAAYLSEKGDLTADLELEYDFFLTQRLILQPRAEVQFSAEGIPDQAIGAGVTNIEAGLRLRYEMMRELAPYIGVEHKSFVGETADIQSSLGFEKSQSYWVLGVRTWF